MAEFETHPNAVSRRDYKDLLGEVMFRRQLDRLGRNLEEEGFNYTWGGVVNTSDLIRDAKYVGVHGKPTLRLDTHNSYDNPQRTAADDNDDRDRVHTMLEDMLRGTRGEKALSFSNGREGEEDITNFTHPDLILWGLVGPATFLKEYGKALGSNKYLLLGKKIGEIRRSGIANDRYMPPEAIELMTKYLDELGESEADKLYLLSGNGIRRAGDAVRTRYPNDRDMIRKVGEEANVAKRLILVGSPPEETLEPVDAGGSVRGEVVSTAREHATNLVSGIREGPLKLVKTLSDGLMGGPPLSDAALAITATAGAAVKGPASAERRRLEARWARRHLPPPTPDNPPEDEGQPAT
jgi:hypothetical protein